MLIAYIQAVVGSVFVRKHMGRTLHEIIHERYQRALIDELHGSGHHVTSMLDCSRNRHHVDHRSRQFATLLGVLVPALTSQERLVYLDHLPHNRDSLFSRNPCRILCMSSRAVFCVTPSCLAIA